MGEKRGMALTTKQAAFVQEYLIDLNGTQAAIRAGYSEKTAQAIATENLTKPLIKEAIADAMAKRAERTEITQDRVLRELAKIGFSDLSGAVSWGSKEVAFGYDADGQRLPADQIMNAALIQRELAPFVEAIPSDMLDEATRGAIAEVALTKDGLRIKMHDKRAALADIGRHLGMFKEIREHSGLNGAPLEIITYSNRDRAKALAALVAKQRQTGS